MSSSLSLVVVRDAQNRKGGQTSLTRHENAPKAGDALSPVSARPIAHVLSPSTRLTEDSPHIARATTLG